MEAIPQLSFDPLFICAAVITTSPFASNCTVIFWQIAAGGILSITVIVAVQEEEFPFTSVMVSVTAFAPTLAQVNELGETVMEAIPQASVLLLLTCAAVTVVFPPASS